MKNTLIISAKIVCFSLLLSSCAILRDNSEDHLLDETMVVGNQEEKTTTHFVSNSQDIPLLSSLIPIDDENLGFDSNSGSISSSSYHSSVSLEEAQDFYLKTLPQMGWRLEINELGKLSFSRDKEKVEIDFINKNGEDVVKFFVSSSL